MIVDPIVEIDEGSDKSVGEEYLSDEDVTILPSPAKKTRMDRQTKEPVRRLRPKSPVIIFYRN